MYAWEQGMLQGLGVGMAAGYAAGAWGQGVLQQYGGRGMGMGHRSKLLVWLSLGRLAGNWKECSLI